MEEANNEPKRRRGIQASRTKLMQALVKAGLKTQADVAERIADLEDLDAAPRGLVNKVFRGESVDPQSIERVARALRVEGWQVYLTADETDAPQPASSEPVPSPTEAARQVSPREQIPHPESPDVTSESEPPLLAIAPTRWWRARTTIVVGMLIACTVILAGAFAWRYSPSADAGKARTAPLLPPSVRAVVVMPITGERGAEFATVFESILAPRYRLLPGSSQTLAPNANPQEVLLARKADALITGHVNKVGRYLALRLYVHTRESIRHGWTEIVPYVASHDYLERRLRLAAAAIGLSEQPPPELAFPNIEAEERFLNGRAHLDKSRTEKNSLRALTELQSALRAAPNYAAAHAALCEALASESIRTGNVDRLTEAVDSCSRAMQLDPASVESLRAQANLDQLQGNIAQSLEYVQRALALNADDTDTLLIAVEAHLIEQAQKPAGQTRPIIDSLLAHAAELEPSNWHIMMAQARSDFAAGQMSKAIAAQERAVAANRNWQTLSNLGAFRYCTADFAAARTAFAAINELQPDEFIGGAQLAAVDFQLRNFEAAASGFRKAIEIHERNGDPHLYQLWGNFGAALRMAKRDEESIAAYRKAIELVEQTVAKGDRSPSARAYRASYYAALGRLAPDSLDMTLRQSLLEDLQSLETAQSPDVLLAVIGSYVFLDQPQKALAVRARLSPECPGYGNSPDFDELKKLRLQ